MDDEPMVADAAYPDPHPHPASPKPSVSRGARACTVCRQAKMKCVGAEDDGAKPCQRCRRSNLRCIFEKHRRGRKPGSKLSETAKMLRKLEKGSTNQKVAIKQPNPPPPPPPRDDPPPDPTTTNTRESIYVPSQAPPATPTTSLNVNPFPTLTAPYSAHPASRPPRNHSPPHSPMDQDGDNNHNNDDDEEDEDDDDPDSDRDINTEAQHIYPAAILERENRKNNYFNTVLGGRDAAKGAGGPHPRRPSLSGKPGDSPDHLPHHLRLPITSRPFLPRYPISFPPLQDPVEAGIITLAQVNAIFDHLFRHLNPFINLFDPQLHTPTYVRERCPFLYTILIMAGCKFWKQDKFRPVQKLVEEFCLRSFVEGPKRVELVQAYMCMTYWKEPDDTRTWMFIGCAARLAIELGLNAYPMSHPSESELQWLERRNRERTYLVLWVHDRSLSMQTGREWMLPETDIIRMADTWHLTSRLLPVDVVVSAQVGLRRCAAEVTDMFYLRWGGRPPADVNYDVLLRCANYRLQSWADAWMDTLERFHGGDFHKALLNFFKLHVRLFLNSIGLFTPKPSNSAVTVCYTSAVETLYLVVNEFSKLDMLRYGQDSVSVMTAYSAVSLLKLLRDWPELNAITNVYDIINSTAQAYEAASKSMVATSSHTVEYHGRFLRSLVVKDQSTRARGRKKEPSGSSSSHGSSGDVGGGGMGGGGLPNFAGSSSAMANILSGNVPEMLVINDVGRVTKMKVGKVPLAQGMGFGSGAPPPPPPQVKQQMMSPPLAVQVPQSPQKGQQVPHEQSSLSGVVNGTQNGHHHQQQQQQQQQRQHQQAILAQNLGKMYHHAAHRPGPVPHSASSAPHHSGTTPTTLAQQQPPMVPLSQHHITQQNHVQMQQQQPYQHPLQGPYGSSGAPAWGFPASPVLPSHPLISPQNEIPTFDLQAGGGGPESVNHRVGTHHPSASASSTNAVAEPGQGPLAPQQQQQQQQPVQGAGGGPYANGSGPQPVALQMEADGESGGMGAGEAGVMAGGGGGPGGTAASLLSTMGDQNMDVAYWYAIHAELGYGSGNMSLMTGMPRAQTPLYMGPQPQPYRDLDGYPETHPGPYPPPPSTHPPPAARAQRGGGGAQSHHHPPMPYLPSG